jgi:hypothetical protein
MDSRGSLDEGAVFPMERPVVHFSTVNSNMPSTKAAQVSLDFILGEWGTLWRTCGSTK